MAETPEDLLIQNMIDLAMLRSLVAHIANEVFDRDRIERVVEGLDQTLEVTPIMQDAVDRAHHRILNAISADLAKRARAAGS